MSLQTYTQKVPCEGVEWEGSSLQELWVAEADKDKSINMPELLNETLSGSVCFNKENFCGR